MNRFYIQNNIPKHNKIHLRVIEFLSYMFFIFDWHYRRHFHGQCIKLKSIIRSGKWSPLCFYHSSCTLVIIITHIYYAFINLFCCGFSSPHRQMGIQIQRYRDTDTNVSGRQWGRLNIFVWFVIIVGWVFFWIFFVAAAVVARWWRL